MNKFAKLLSVAFMVALVAFFAGLSGVSAQTPNIGMALSSESVSRCPGSAETLELTLSNFDDVTHTYVLSMQMPQGWKIPDSGFIPYCADCPDQQGITLASGETRKVTFWINPPITGPGTYDVKVVAKAGVEEAYKNVRVEVLRCHDVTIDTPGTIDICSGAEFQYTFGVTNNGKESEVFDIVASGSWGAELYRESLAIGPGQKSDIAFVVAALKASGSITVKAASKTSYASDERTTQVNVKKCYDFQAAMVPGETSSCLGVPSEFVLTIRNAGTASDSYAIQAPSWVAVGEGNVTVMPGEQKNIALLANPSKKGKTPFEVTVSSKGLAQLKSTLTATTEAVECKGVVVIVSPAKQEVCRGAQAGFNITVKNTGTVSTTYDIEATGTLESNKVVLGPGEVKELSLKIDTKDLKTGDNQITATAKSGVTADQDVVQLAVRNCYSAEFSASPAAPSVCEGDEITYTINVKNTGEFADNYTISFGEKEIGNVSLASGGSKTFSAKLMTKGFAEGVRNLTFALASPYTLREVPSSVTIKPAASCYRAEITSDGPLSMVEPGKGIVIAVKVKNGGEKPDTYMIGLAGPEWVHISQDNVSLGPGEEAGIYLYASPGFDVAKKTYSAVVTAASGYSAPSNFTFRIGVGVSTGKVILLALIVLLILIILVVKFVLFVK